MPVIISGAVSGATTLQATDAVTATITLPSATDTLVGKATTDTLTNKTLTLPVVGTTIGVGAATPSASGAGITFPATQSASTNANTLDDYEEGTWTPTVASTVGSLGAVTTNLGTYTKIGKLVTLQIYHNINNGTGSGTISITNIPFAPDTTLRYVAGTGLNLSSVAQNSMYLDTATSTIGCQKYDGTFPAAFCSYTISYWATA